MVVSDWIEHDGKGMPVDGETFVLVRWGDGYEETEGDFVGWRQDTAAYWGDTDPDKNCWISKGGPASTITHYRIVTPDA